MDYIKKYQEKLTSPEEAVKIVKSGDWIDYGSTLLVPKILDVALSKRAKELSDINIRTLLPMHKLAVLEANNRFKNNIFTVNSFHFGKLERDNLLLGNKDCFFIPMRYSELPKFYRNDEDISSVDVAMIQVTSMDRFGYFSFGPTNSHIYEMLRKSKKVILEVNENMPRVFGLKDDLIHIDDVDYIVENSSDLDTIANTKSSEIDNKIASFVIPLLKDKCNIQLGIGGIPNAIGNQISKSDLRDLGIHTEMYVNSMMDMTKAGIITGKYKKLDRGKQVYSFCAGTMDLYEYIRENPAIYSAPVDYVNSTEIISMLDNFVSINTAIEIDLYGQINAETSGVKHLTGTGGQLDFVMGAYKSKNGKSIIALSSTFIDQNGEVHSRIIPKYLNGSSITDPRTTTNYVATEYGIVNLKGKSMWQRAEALISLAHPDFREDLIKQAEEQKIWRKTNKTE